MSAETEPRRRARGRRVGCPVGGRASAEPEPHHRSQNQPARYPHRRPGDQPAGCPRRRPGVRWDGTPPPDPGQPAGRPRRRPGIGQDGVPPPAPGPIGWVPRWRPRRPRRNPAAGPGPDRLGVPPPEARHRPGRNPAAGPGIDDRLGDPGRRPGTGRHGSRRRARGRSAGCRRLEGFGVAGGLRVPGGGTRPVMRGVRCRSGQGFPRRRHFSRPRGTQPRTAEPGGAEPTSPTRSVPGQAGGAQTHRDPQAVRQAGPQRRTAQASASVTRPSAR